MLTLVFKLLLFVTLSVVGTQRGTYIQTFAINNSAGRNSECKNSLYIEPGQSYSFGLKLYPPKTYLSRLFKVGSDAWRVRHRKSILPI